MTTIYIIGSSSQLDFARHLALNYFREGKQRVLHANVPQALDSIGRRHSELTERQVMEIKEGHVVIEHDLPRALQTLDWVMSEGHCDFIHTVHTRRGVPDYEATRLFPHERADGAYRLMMPRRSDTAKNGLVVLAQQNRCLATVYSCRSYSVTLETGSDELAHVRAFVALAARVPTKHPLEIRVNVTKE